MPRRIDTYRGLAQSSRLKVLDIILDRPAIGFADLSQATGLHENTLRDHLRVLESEGFIRSELQHTGGRGRPRSLFSAVRGDEPHDDAERRVAEAKRQGDLLRRVLPSTTASTLDDDALHQIDALYQHLDDVGLDPDIDESELVVELNPCPFHSLLEDNREVACRVHEELIRGVLHRAGGPVELERLLPYTTPQSCHVHLAMRTQPPDQAATE